MNKEIGPFLNIAQVPSLSRDILSYQWLIKENL